MIKIKKIIIKVFIVLDLFMAVAVVSSESVASKRIAARKEQALQHHLDRLSPRAGRSSHQEVMPQRAQFTPSNLSRVPKSVEGFSSDSSTSRTEQGNSVDSLQSDHEAAPTIELAQDVLHDTSEAPEVMSVNDDVVVDPVVLNLSNSSSTPRRKIKPESLEQHHVDQDVSPVFELSPIKELALSGVDPNFLKQDLVLSDLDSDSLEDDKLEVLLVKNDIVDGYQLFIQNKSLLWLEKELQRLSLRTKELASLLYEQMNDESLTEEQRVQRLSAIEMLSRQTFAFLQVVQDIIAQKVSQKSIKDLQKNRLQEKQNYFERKSFLDKFISGATLSY